MCRVLVLQKLQFLFVNNDKEPPSTGPVHRGARGRFLGGVGGSGFRVLGLRA